MGKKKKAVSKSVVKKKTKKILKKRSSVEKKLYGYKICPICGEKTDFLALGNKNTPFIDGKKYPEMCFTCFYTPKREIQHYKEDGSLDYIEGPLYSYRYLYTPEEMVREGIADSLEQARKSLRGVKRKIKQAGIRNLRKLKLKPPPSSSYRIVYADERRRK